MATLPQGPVPVFPAGQTAQTPEAQARYIVDLVNSGQKLSTDQILALQTSLAGLQGVQNAQLRQAATNVLAGYTGGLQGVWQNTQDVTGQALANQQAAADQATYNDLGAVNYLHDASGQASGIEQNAIDALGTNYENNDAINRGLYDQYGNAIGSGLGYEMGGVNNVQNATDTTNAQNAALAGQYGKYLAGLNQYDLSGVNNVQGATDTTNAANRAALQSLLQGAGHANAVDQNTINQLEQANRNVAYINPAGYGPDIVSQAARAGANPADIQAERQSLQGFQDLSNPSITASERYNMELARREEEQTQRAALEAELSNLSARGIRSGGAEIGALLGSAQNTGQQRSLQDMAALQQANDRAMQARSQAAQLASTMRGQGYGENYQTGSAADAVAQFNKAQSIANQQWQNETQIRQQQAAYQRAADLAQTQLAANNGVYGRATGVYQAGMGNNQQNLGNTQQSLQNALGVSNTAGNRATQATNTALGVSQGNLGNTQQSFTNAVGVANTGLQQAQNLTNTGLAVDKTSADLANQLATIQLGAANDQYARGKDVAGSIAGADQAYYNRQADTAQATRTAAQQALQGAGTVFDAAAQTAGVATGTTPQPIQDALSNQVAANQAAAAQKAIKDNNGLLGGSIIPGVL